AVLATGARFVPLDDRRAPRPGRPPTPSAILEALLRPPPRLAHRAAHLRGTGAVLVHDAMQVWGGRLGLPSVAFATTALLNRHVIAESLAGREPGGDARARRWRQLIAASPVTDLLTRLARPLAPRGPLTIVPIPREFQPHAASFGPQYRFVGPCLAPRPADVPLPGGLDPRRPLVLVSLGTGLNHRPQFYAACLAAFAGSRWQVVMAVGDRTRVADLGPIPDNAVVRPKVPQLHLLERARAFVSHAGMGSVMEAAHHGVPLVLHPQMPEQGANADRIVAHGAGIRLGRNPGAAEIRRAVEHVTTDPRIASGTAGLRAAVRSTGGAPAAADDLQEFRSAIRLRPLPPPPEDDEESYR
ncbi:MAG TPA: nucleotide disphospho-sugar-binding domain-containing protein, partial [Pseudonocardia sp.]|nr:nucleotide disphospho-sugar-binding domain-containing protein [Pseudonocardia sp.]